MRKRRRVLVVGSVLGVLGLAGAVAAEPSRNPEELPLQSFTRELGPATPLFGAGASARVVGPREQGPGDAAPAPARPAAPARGRDFQWDFPGSER